MMDISTQWLMQQIQQCAESNVVWCCDENVLHQLNAAIHWQCKPRFFSNRCDIATHATQLGFNSQFNDFDLSAIPSGSVDHFFYRISKEKAISHHLINEAQRVLKPHGTLWLSGQKNEGIKTYIEKASILFGCAKNIQKNGPSYSSQICKKLSAPPTQTSLLDDFNYHQLRECISINEQPIFSKPGQFGWNKIDQGSAFLIQEVSALLANQTTEFERFLDLGCGYGFLTIASLSIPIKNRVLTDNNAAALISARHNCTQLKLTADIIESDAGQNIAGKFDLILCNPPFHQGFSVDDDLTEKFLVNTKHLLATHGVAYFVVNQFIPLEKKALPHFKTVALIAQNKSFKVIELRLTPAQ